jgi:pantoate kinase
MGKGVQNTMTKASAFCPAGISSFFQAVTNSSPPRSITAACRIGARGGGFIIDKGVATEVKITSTKKTGIAVTINGKNAPEANVTREVFKLLLSKINKPYQISVSHHVEVPIGAGYGASAAGAVSTAMALAKVLDLKMTMNQIAQIAHTAEIRCATGLGSVSGVIRGGAILILEPGAPGYDRVDWLPMNPSHRIVTASFAPISKKDIIFSKKALQAVNREGQKVLQQILSNPDPVQFMKLCRGFAQKAGFLSDRIAEVIEKVMNAGALGATQNMIGDAFHALVNVRDVDSVVGSVADDFKSEVFVSRISRGGPIIT